MPRSMTGYGFANATSDGVTVSVELRSVNNRFLDINLRIPKSLYSREAEIRDIVRGRIARGRVSLQITEEWDLDHAPALRVETGKALEYFKALQQLRAALDIQDEISLNQLLSVAEVLRPEEDEDYGVKLWDLTRKALNESLEIHLELSTREGANLTRDLRDRIGDIRSERDKIARMADEQAGMYGERLRARVEELFTDPRIDESRLETEVALSADRLDISEELVRLNSHIDLFDRTLSGGGVIGKTLGFILQEMGREANTIASKSWLVDISKSAIRMKEILEQIREQVQNIE